MNSVNELASTRGLGPLLSLLRERGARHKLVAHWKQGEFHHDLLFEVRDRTLPGSILLVSTNCNGGVKSVMCFAQKPTRSALWAHRCPDNPAFSGTLPEILAEARTVHYFDPCEVLLPDARSELLATARKRQYGGGWLPIDAEDDWQVDRLQFA